MHITLVLTMFLINNNSYVNCGGVGGLDGNVGYRDE